MTSWVSLSELDVGAHGVNWHGAAVAVVAGVGGVLEIGGNREPLGDLPAVVGLQDLLLGVAERAVAQDQALGPSGGQIRPVAGHNGVGDACDAERVVPATPEGPN